MALSSQGMGTGAALSTRSLGQHVLPRSYWTASIRGSTVVDMNMINRTSMMGVVSYCRTSLVSEQGLNNSEFQPHRLNISWVHTILARWSTARACTMTATSRRDSWWIKNTITTSGTALPEATAFVYNLVIFHIFSIALYTILYKIYDTNRR